MPKVSGHSLNNSRFSETPPGDWVRSALGGRLAVQFPTKITVDQFLFEVARGIERNNRTAATKLKASELRRLLAALCVPRKVDLQSMTAMMTDGIPPACPLDFRAILPAGRSMIAEAAGAVRVSRWTFLLSPTIRCNRRYAGIDGSRSACPPRV